MNSVSRTLRGACQVGDLPLVKKYIDLGADVNEIVPSTGWFPLGSAVNSSHRLIVKELLAAGANPRMRTRCGWSLLYIAVRRSNYRIAKMLLDAEVGTRRWGCTDQQYRQ
jgi:ankyrin repeat protein